MTKKELQQYIADLDQKIGSAEALQQKVNEADRILQETKTQIAQLTESNQKLSLLLTEVLTKKEEIQSLRDNLEEAVQGARAHAETIAEQRKEYDEFKLNYESLKKNAEELEGLARNQLGLVAMETLANSFAGEAVNLKSSTRKWFWHVIGVTIVLVIAVLGISIWQVLHEGALLRWGFAARLPIAAPIIFYLAFVSSQYSRDKRLLEEYSFKASIARSFEAYRKVVHEEIPEDEKSKKTSFVVETIQSIYSSPMKNISDNRSGKDENGEASGWFKRILDTLKEIKDVLPK